MEELNKKNGSGEAKFEVAIIIKMTKNKALGGIVVTVRTCDTLEAELIENDS